MARKGRCETCSQSSPSPWAARCLLQWSASLAFLARRSAQEVATSGSSAPPETPARQPMARKQKKSGLDNKKDVESLLKIANSQALSKRYLNPSTRFKSLPSARLCPSWTIRLASSDETCFPDSENLQGQCRQCMHYIKLDKYTKTNLHPTNVHLPLRTWTQNVRARKATNARTGCIHRILHS